MGVRVSTANLAAAVANTGAAGVIASVGLGDYQDAPGKDFSKLNAIALKAQIQKARQLSDGVIGVNAMVALTDYEELVGVCVQEKVDMIISGAGLPLHLPAYTQGTDIKLIPIVSSARSLKIIHKKWMKDFNRCPDAVIIEGAKAGGHLGYSFEQIEENSSTLEQTLADVLELVKKLKIEIPVIVAGGIFTGADIAHYLKLGASGVQMGTRFVCTEECDVDIKFKQAYLDAGPEDITLIKSPVGLPGRVINNEFVQQINAGQRVPFKCKYQCLKTCNPAKAPYCIAEVLAFAFAGSNACRCNEIVSVKELIRRILTEYEKADIAELTQSM